MSERYRAIALAGARRFLSGLDRKPWSPTYGCGDRDYWCYKTLRGFPRANFQQGVWGLALLYRTPFVGNEFTGRPAVLEWINSALAWWDGARHADGSVDEWYRHERSFCGTAFTAAAVAETLLLVGRELPPAMYARLIRSLVSTVTWLGKHKHPAAANQMTAALVAVEGVSRLTGRADMKALYEAWKTDVLRLQHEEGWFVEYGGADLGYSFLTVDLLAHLWDRTQDRELKQALDRLLEFVGCFARAGVVGGFGGSRQTTHAFPCGVERLAAAGNPSARSILGIVRRAIDQAGVPTPMTADDTYAAYFYLNAYCLAACADFPPVSGGEEEARSEDMSRYFAGAGWYCHRTPTYEAVIDTRMGAWRLVTADGRVHGDAGYIVQAAGGQVFSSAQARRAAESTIDNVSEGWPRIQVRTRFARVETRLPLTRHAVSFMLFTQYVLAVPRIAQWFGRQLKQRNARGGALAGLTLSRSWRLSPEGLELDDDIRTTDGMVVARLHRAAEGGGMHSPSSQLFVPSLLDVGSLAHLPRETEALRSQGAAHLHQAIRCGDQVAGPETARASIASETAERF